MQEEQLTHRAVVRYSHQLQGLIKNQFIKWKQRKQGERGIISSERHCLNNMHLHSRKWKIGILTHLPILIKVKLILNSSLSFELILLG